MLCHRCMPLGVKNSKQHLPHTLTPQPRGQLVRLNTSYGAQHHVRGSRYKRLCSVRNPSSAPPQNAPSPMFNVCRALQALNRHTRYQTMHS